MNSHPANELASLYDQLANKTIELLEAMHSKHPDPFVVLSLRNKVKQIQSEILEMRNEEAKKSATETHLPAGKAGRH